MKNVMIALTLIFFSLTSNANEICGRVKKLDLNDYLKVTLDNGQTITLWDGINLHYSIVVAGLTSNLKVCFAPETSNGETHYQVRSAASGE